MLKAKVKKEFKNWGKIFYYTSLDKGLFRFALYTYNDDLDTLYFSNLFVNEANRTQGIGKTIINYVKQYALQNNRNTIILKVLKTSWVKKWYESIGFKELEDAGDNYMWMKLSLN